MDWSAAQYRKFEAERTQPVRDLLARLRAMAVARAADLGCGPGNSTELLQARFPAAAITGLDSSPDMLAAAQARLPGVRFELGDIATWADPGPFEVILANASLQWVPDHAKLLPALLARLAPGGRLAVQVPDNADEPSHRLMRELAGEGSWAARLTPLPRTMNNRHGAEWYYRLLRAEGASVELWRTVYYHQLGGTDAVVEWLMGTSLRPFLAPLDADQASLFLARYRAALAEAYPPLPDGTVLLRYPRLFFIATRGLGKAR